MPQGFPPLPVYPADIDSDYTLYQVYDTTESFLASDNQAWEDEVEIIPVPFGTPEIWAENGFANISGELFYYDAVGKTTDGRINTLKRCARNLGGTFTQFNVAGTPVRAFVVAQHHNQLAQAMLNIQDFVGINFDTRFETLDYRIRHLQATPPIWDDWSCPDATLSFFIVSSDPASGTVANYSVQTSGSYNSFRLDFGDGTFTTSAQAGTHTYAPNATIDPVITIGNDSCQVISTNIERTNQSEPTPQTNTPTLTIPIPEFSPLPTLIFPTLGPIAPIMDFPPIVFPCISISPFSGTNISIGPINIQVPSVISFTPLNIPSIIAFSPLDIPSTITITPVSIPSTITFVNPPTFTPIGFAPAPVIAPIAFAPPPTISPIGVNITVTIDGSGIPSCLSMCSSPSMIGIDWGTPPTLNVAFVSKVASQKSSKYSAEDLKLMKELGDDYKDFFPEADSFEVEYDSIGIPTEIKIVPPQFPEIKVSHDIPKQIEIVAGNFDLDGTIQILPPATPLPTEIHVINKGVPTFIELLSDVPSVIRVDHNIPDHIVIESLVEIPSVIKLDGSDIREEIRLVGAPETIELVFPQQVIKLVPDESLESLEIPLVFKSAPIECKIDMPKWLSAPDDDDDEYPRVKIIPAPCPKR